MTQLPEYEFSDVEIALRAMREHKLRLNNLFELPSGIWQANLYNTEHETMSGWGQATTAAGALRAAMTEATWTKLKSKINVNTKCDPAPSSAPAGPMDWDGVF